MLVLLAAPPVARNAFLVQPPSADSIHCKERSVNQIDAPVTTFVCRNIMADAGNPDIDRCYIYDTAENVITKYWVDQKIEGCLRRSAAFFR